MQLYVANGQFNGSAYSACSRHTGTGLGRVYRHQSSAEQDIARDLSQARWIKALAGRGNVPTREAFSLRGRGSCPRSPSRSCCRATVYRDHRLSIDRIVAGPPSGLVLGLDDDVDWPESRRGGRLQPTLRVDSADWVIAR